MCDVWYLKTTWTQQQFCHQQSVNVIVFWLHFTTSTHISVHVLCNPLQLGRSTLTCFWMRVASFIGMRAKSGDLGEDSSSSLAEASFADDVLLPLPLEWFAAAGSEWVPQNLRPWFSARNWCVAQIQVGLWSLHLHGRGWRIFLTFAFGHEHWAVTKDLEQTWLKLGALFYKNKELSEELLSLLLNGASWGIWSWFLWRAMSSELFWAGPSWRKASR